MRIECIGHITASVSKQIHVEEPCWKPHVQNDWLLKQRHWKTNRNMGRRRRFVEYIKRKLPLKGGASQCLRKTKRWTEKRHWEIFFR